MCYRHEGKEEAQESCEVWELHPSPPQWWNTKVFIAALKPVFHVLMKYFALSTASNCEGGTGGVGKNPHKIWKLQKFTSIMNWWPWPILAMGSGPAEGTQLPREDPVLPNLSMRISESRNLSPTERQRRAGSPSWTTLCRIWGAAGTGATLCGGQVASPGMTA